MQRVVTEFKCLSVSRRYLFPRFYEGHIITNTLTMATSQRGNGDTPSLMCCVCNGHSEPSNTVIACDCCGIHVHQACYGVGEVSSENWLCDVCVSFDRQLPRGGIKCLVCPSRRGAFKPARKFTSAMSAKQIAAGLVGGDNGGLNPSSDWCHIVCGFWLTATSFVDATTLRPIVVKIPKVATKKRSHDFNAITSYFSACNLSRARFRPFKADHCVVSDGLECQVCHTIWGLTAKCRAVGCSARFHPCCALGADVHMEIEATMDSNGMYTGAVQFQLFCAQHSAELYDEGKAPPLFPTPTRAFVPKRAKTFATLTNAVRNTVMIVDMGNGSCEWTLNVRSWLAFGVV